MKKALIAAVALMMAASISLAGMGIDWSNGGWMAEYGGDPSGDGPWVLDNNNVLWQLIYTSESAPATPDLTQPNYLGSDKEQLIADREIPQGGGSAADGTSWDNYLMKQGGTTLYQDLDWTTAGSVYQRIWQGTPSVEEGGYYFDSALLTIDTGYAGGGAAGQGFDYDPSGNGVAINNYIEGEQPGPGPQPAVPEPATMSLLGLGALAMVLRRKLSK